MTTESLIASLRATTEEMANHCQVNFDLWQRHSSAVLEAATLLDTLTNSAVSLQEARLKQALVKVRNVRPVNWDDDPELVEAWLDADAALAGQAP